MSPVFQNRNVPFGRRDSSTFGEGCRKAFAPGMIWGRLVGRQELVDIFGRNPLGLFGLLVENRIGQRLAFVADRDILVYVLANGHDRLAHRIGGALGLDLIDHLFKLDRQVFRKDAEFLPSQNPSEVVFGGEGAMGIHGASRFDGKAPVEILDELCEVSVAVHQGGDAT